MIDAVRARYPLWSRLSLDAATQARQHPLSWLLKVIEDTYDARYAHDVAELEYIAGDPDLAPGEFGISAGDVIGEHPFPEFVQAQCARQYGVKALAEKASWEVMCNAEAARSAGLHASVDLFCAFCNRGYDDEELMFFLYCRQTLLVELTRDVNRSSGGGGSPGPGEGLPYGARQKKKALNHVREQDAERRFHAGGAVPATVPGSVITEREAKDVTRRVFGAGGGMLYRAVTQLIGDFFENKRAENPKPSPDDPPPTMEAYYYLKLMLSAYRDTRPGVNASDGNHSVDLSDVNAGARGAYGDPLGFDEHAYYANTDADTTFDDDRARTISEPSASAQSSPGRYNARESASGRGVSATPSPKSKSPAGPAAASAGSPPPLPSPHTAASEENGSAEASARGASVRAIRRAITDSCSKYCDVLLQVAQDLPPDALEELKAKAVRELDGHSQDLFSGALAAAFGSGENSPGGAGKHSPGAPSAREVAATEPEVVAAVARCVSELLRKNGGVSPGNAGARSGEKEAREAARVVLASGTIRSHVEPLLTRLLSELDEEMEEQEEESA